MASNILPLSFSLLLAVSLTTSSPLTAQEQKNGETEVKAKETLPLNSQLISKMDPILQSYFKNKEDNQQFILAVNQLEASLKNLYTVLDLKNEERRRELKRFSRQDDEEEPELLIQIGQLLGSIFTGGFRESIVEGGRQAIKKRFPGLVQSKITTKAATTTNRPS